MKKKAIYLIAAAVAVLIAVSSCTPETPLDPSVLSVEADNGGVLRADGGVLNIRVTSNVSWTVSKAEADAWIALDVANGKNDGLVKVSFDANPGPSGREAIISFRSESIDNPTTVTIKQAAPTSTTDRRIAVDFTDAQAIYYGDAWGVNADNWLLGLCFDGAAYSDPHTVLYPGAFLQLDLYAEVDSGSEYIPDGTYTFAETAAPGVIASGFSMFFDLDMDVAAKVEEGTVTVIRSGEKYKIIFGVKTELDLRLTGTYEGPLRHLDFSDLTRGALQDPAVKKGIAYQKKLLHHEQRYLKQGASIVSGE